MTLALLRHLSHARAKAWALATAWGQFRRVIDEKVQPWSLTKPEQSVPVTSLQGDAIEKIAVMGRSAVESFRARLTKIHLKSAASSRVQLDFVFDERLMTQNPARWSNGSLEKPDRS